MTIKMTSWTFAQLGQATLKAFDHGKYTQLGLLQEEVGIKVHINCSGMCHEERWNALYW